MPQLPDPLLQIEWVTLFAAAFAAVATLAALLRRRQPQPVPARADRATILQNRTRRFGRYAGVGFNRRGMSTPTRNSRNRVRDLRQARMKKRNG